VVEYSFNSDNVSVQLNIGLNEGLHCTSLARGCAWLQAPDVAARALALPKSVGAMSAVRWRRSDCP
jgi:hypothetical protein